MTEIQQNRWDRLVRRVAGIVGGGSQVNDTLNELFPTIDVENVPGELLALANMRLGWVSGRLAASAAEFNLHQIFNPANSGTLVVITQVNGFSEAANTIFRFSLFIGSLATLAGNERPRDTRRGVTAELTGQHRTDQSVVAGGLDFRVAVLADTSFTLKDDNGICVLFPGTGLTVTNSTLNQDSTVAFMWRERAFEPSEQLANG